MDNSHKVKRYPSRSVCNSNAIKYYKLKQPHFGLPTVNLTLCGPCYPVYNSNISIGATCTRARLLLAI